MLIVLTNYSVLRMQSRVLIQYCKATANYLGQNDVMGTTCDTHGPSFQQLRTSLEPGLNNITNLGSIITFAIRPFASFHITVSAEIEVL